ncbi:TPA: SDR family NAD(P)-dependent oxidoreductase [Burkholderia cepacia]|uniref:SDR family NAD(P)-dependent oxidoreductase n=1 Tax=Burkholderia cepacia TaxID=292 RepID=UPI001CF1DB36|nr:SDR family NAD(P)-dependent oxidoreductase [Burkholderia cepacia]MCA8361982.1 SDR family NAD(P)-dependent oxidoreductase [Burkholderia cepacia]HDR9759578.1 SDR family NAD(P)-dependent oxidoreductase [Burkholderia cepacia ATCC 25416]HDV6367630.1 SDR family NAD(P)-dependent oxidoreductase [Burkholderia cepacia]
MTRAVLRHVVITGASAGIGRALARAYSGPGTILGLVGRDVERLSEIALECRELGAEVVIGQLDVRDGRAAETWVRQFDASYPIDLLIANAGIASTLASSADWEGIERTAQVVDTNFYGSLNIVFPALECMRGRRRGQVAVVTSLAALRGMAISPAYCASKAALKAFADSLRPLLKQDGISLTVILPGFVKTAMSDGFPGGKPFMWTTDKAAIHIRGKLAARRPEIAFPCLLNLGMRILQILPIGMADAILGVLYPVPRKER